MLLALLGPALILPSLMATPKAAAEYRIKEQFLESPESFSFTLSERTQLANYISRSDSKETGSVIYLLCTFPVLFGISIYGLVREKKHNNVLTSFSGYSTK